MSSVRVLLCDLCAIVVFGLYLVGADEKTTTPATIDEGPKGNCSCGGFPTDTPKEGEAPLLSQSPGLVIQCNLEGVTTCQSLCVALATATKAKGPEILCNRLKNADELKLSAFFKACDKPWSFANMTAEVPLCCVNSKVKTCASVQSSNTTTPMPSPSNS